MAQFLIQPRGPRPDYRLVITFLWDDFHNVDTDGNSYNPASHDWTQLYCTNREATRERFDVVPVQDNPLTLRVRSEQPELAARVAFFLAAETNSLVAEGDGGPWHDRGWLRDKVGAFDLGQAESRAAASCWRRATLADPYPNLKDRGCSGGAI